MIGRALLYGGTGVVVLGALLLLAARLIGPAGFMLTVENHTPVDLCVDINGGGYEEVKGYDERAFRRRTARDGSESIEITVRTEQGGLVHHEVATAKELAERGNTVVIVGYATLMGRRPGPFECRQDE